MKVKKLLLLVFLSFFIAVGDSKGVRITKSFMPEQEPQNQKVATSVQKSALLFDEEKGSYYFERSSPKEQRYSASTPSRKDGFAVSYQLLSPYDNTLLVSSNSPSSLITLGFPLVSGVVSGLAAYACQLPILPFSLGGAALGGIVPIYSIYSAPTCGAPEKLLTSKDRRKRVKDEILTSWPFRVHGQLQLDYIYSGGITRTYIGTGTLVGESHVLTAGHNLFDHKAREHVKTVKFYPAKSGENIPWEATGIEVSIHPRYVDARNPEERFERDIGMVKLDKPLGGELGYFGLRTLSDEEKPIVTIAGYPGEEPYSGKYMYQMKGNITQHYPTQTEYDIDTTPGQSGSGVWTDEYECVAVHTCGKTPNNSGTRLNYGYSKMVEEWLK